MLSGSPVRCARGKFGVRERQMSRRDELGNEGWKLLNHSFPTPREMVEAFNVFRKEHKGECIEFTEYDLAELDLAGIDFSGMTFNSVSFHRTVLTDADFSGAYLYDCGLENLNQPAAMWATVKGLDTVWGLPHGIFANAVAAGWTKAEK